MIGNLTVPHEEPITTNRFNDLEPFILKPDHRHFALGYSDCLNPKGRFGTLWVVAIFLMLGVCGFTVFNVVVQQTIQWHKFAEQGVVANAFYLSKHTENDSDGDTYYVTYQYKIDGQDYSHEQTVSWDVYSPVESDTKVQILYLPSDPHQATILATNQPPVIPLACAVIWNGILLAMIIGTFLQGRKVRLLEHRGERLHGQIISSNASTDGDGDLVLKIEYAFQSPQLGERITKTAQANRNDLTRKTIPTADTPVVVLYYNDRNFMLL